MRLLLTGGCGFVGHHLVEGVLKKTDWEIVVLDALTYAGNLNRLKDISIWEKEKKRVKFVWHDLKAPISKTTDKLIGEIDYIWHLSAESHVQKSLEDSIPFVLSNVLGTAYLLEWLKEKNFKVYIGFNTDEVFGPAPLEVNYKEKDKFYPSNPYSATKASQWCLEYSFYKSFQMPIIQVHSMNIYGERQHPEKFIPKTVKAILKKEKVIIHGLPGNISSRKWIHAREVCNALLFLTAEGKIGETYNVVGKEMDVLTLANFISKTIRGKELSEKEIEFIDFHATRPGHDRRYSLDGSKLAKLGFRPELTLEKSLKKTIEWMIEPENRKWLN